MLRTKTGPRPIRTATDRAALPVSRSIVWEVITKGRRLGFQKVSSTRGIWHASIRNEGGTYTQNSLGSLPGHSEALQAANEWFAARHGVQPGRVTVEQACGLYVESLRMEGRHKTAEDSAARFRRLVNGTTFGRHHVDSLTPAHCTAFRNRLVRPTEDYEENRASKSSANRNWAQIRAALNWAYRHGMSVNKPWETATPFPDVTGKRDEFLTVQQRHALLDALPADVRQFAQAMLLTALRPGELFSANVADFNPNLGTLSVRRSKTLVRTCTLSTAAMTFLRDLTRNRSGNEPLLPRATPALRRDGNIDYRMDRTFTKVATRKAAATAGLPDGVVLYTLRHVAISEMLLAGMDATVVALLAGTSTDMIERHYGHMKGAKIRNTLDKVKVL